MDEQSVVDHSVVLPSARVGRNCRISRAVIGENCVIPDGLVIGENRDIDEERFYVTHKGVVLVVPEMINALTGKR